MQYIGWFALGLLLSVINILSLNHSVSGLHNLRSTRRFLMGYTFRLVLTGLGLLLAVQFGHIELLSVFLGILVFRWALLLPKFNRFLLNR